MEQLFADAGGTWRPSADDKRGASPAASSHGADYITTLLFEDIDEDGSGFITYTEFAGWLDKKRTRLSERDKRALFDYIDENKSGQLSISELHKFRIQSEFQRDIEDLARRAKSSRVNHKQRSKSWDQREDEPLLSGSQRNDHRRTSSWMSNTTGKVFTT